MKKTLYSLMLNDEVVREVDGNGAVGSNPTRSAKNPVISGLLPI